MLEIALIGAPGAGKTQLAHEITKRYFGEDPPPCVVDEYMKDFEIYDVAIGIWADMYVNHWIWYHRMGVEGKRRSALQHVSPLMITCGSGLDTIAYANLYIESCNFDIVTPTLRPHVQKAILGYELLMHYGASKLTKDLFYILPLPARDTKTLDGYFNSRVNDKLVELNVRGKMEIPVLTGTKKQNAQRILRDISAAEKKLEEAHAISG